MVRQARTTPSFLEHARHSGEHQDTMPDAGRAAGAAAACVTGAALPS